MVLQLEGLGEPVLPGGRIDGLLDALLPGVWIVSTVTAVQSRAERAVPGAVSLGPTRRMFVLQRGWFLKALCAPFHKFGCQVREGVIVEMNCLCLHSLD